MSFDKNYLLNKKVIIFQPIDGYRASIDAVLLSSAIKEIKKNDNILDVGSGTGAISLCLAYRFREASEIIGLELQTRLFELSNISAKENGFKNLKYLNQDIRKKIETPDSTLKHNSFSHVITNPPYSEKDMPSPNESKKTAHNHQDFSLKKWIDFCIKMMKPKGYFYMINRSEATDEILSHIHGKLGDIKIIPIYSKDNQDAKRVIIIARKDNKSPTKINKGIVLHQENGEYTKMTNEILQDGKSINY